MSEPKYAPVKVSGETHTTLPEQEKNNAADAGRRFTALDVVFAFVFLLLGHLFWDLQVWRDGFWFGPDTGTAVFAVLFASAVLCWMFLSGTLPAWESWFWLAVVLFLSFSYLLPYGGDLFDGAEYLALLAVVHYWVIAAGRRLYKNGKTSNWLFFDIMNALFVAPWANFGRLPAAILSAVRIARARRKERKQKRGRDNERAKRVGAVLGGVGAAAVCLCVVLPLLMSADSGFASLFSGLVRAIDDWFEDFSFDALELTVKLICAIPTALYLYGLTFAAIHGRHMALFERGDICAAQRGMRVAPRATVGVALGVLGGVYALFLLVQARYLFGAFWGALPEGFTYAEYARQGFFELCRVAGVNACILIFANVFSRSQPGEWHALRVLNAVIAALTLLLLATAAAKMALYIGAYGLTVKRILASTALLWLVVVFACVLIRQFRQARRLPIVQIAVLSGALLFTMLCVFPVEDSAASYNAAHGPSITEAIFTSHTLSTDL